MSGLRHGFKWNASGITARLGNDLASALAYLRDVHSFSVAVSEFLRGVSNVALLQGQLLEVVVRDPSVVPGVQYFPHSLGRRYRGALLAGTSTNALILTLLTPQTVSALGQDPAKVLGIVPVALANADAACTVWIF